MLLLGLVGSVDGCLANFSKPVNSLEFVLCFNAVPSMMFITGIFCNIYTMKAIQRCKGVQLC